jgi:hypothetical protein
MKAPAVGTSSKAMRRPNSKADRHTPDGPPTCTACVSRAPQSSRMRPMRVPNGYSYRPGRSQSPDTEWILVPVDLRRADAGPPGAAVQRDVRRGAEGLDVVDHVVGWPEVAVLDRERRADARRAALAFQRFDQRRLLAADVGAGAEVDLRCRSRSRRGPGSTRPAARSRRRCSTACSGSSRIAVFAAQVDQAVARADHQRGDGHAFEHRVGVAVQQHPVLEGAGLALVGVAHHHMRAARRLRGTGAHLVAGGKPAPPRPRSLERFISSSMASGPRASAAAAPRPACGAGPAARRRAHVVVAPRTSRPAIDATGTGLDQVGQLPRAPRRAGSPPGGG